MARYYFSEQSAFVDPGLEDDWIEFSSLQAACDDAERALRSIMAEASLATTSFTMTVFDAAGSAVHHARIDSWSEPARTGSA